jgi:cob(I)alamin adenosyltransferase
LWPIHSHPIEQQKHQGVIQLMVKIYTRTGDDGTTGLFGRDRVSKCSQIIQTLGDIDELNSFVGLLNSFSLTDPQLHSELRRIQNQLFDIGSAIAAPLDSPLVSNLATNISTDVLEAQIDRMQSELPTLQNFILPGGGRESAAAHVCRATCRKAERSLVTFYDSAAQPLEFLTTIQYFNRLSDYFFVVARYLNHQAGLEDVLWEPTTLK